MQALSHKGYEDIFKSPGRHDLTAHVDFYALQESIRSDVKRLGPQRQGEFLKKMGIFQYAELLQMKATERQCSDIVTGLHRLTASSEMGQLFKVMGILQRGLGVNPVGFA